MEKQKLSFDLLDYLLVILKWKKVLIIISIIVLVLSYISIYLFIPPEYDSTSLIIPSQQEQFGGISSFLKNIGNLPIGLGGFSKNDVIDKYKTIIYSRTTLDKIIAEFNLLSDYNLESLENARKVLKDKIKADETPENAFSIKVRAYDPEKSAQINNFIIDELNSKIIELNIQKAKDNRIFLEERYGEIKNNLKQAEDSLNSFQKKFGIFEAEEQTKKTVEEFAKMEAELANKKIELKILEKIYGENAPQVLAHSISVDEFQKSYEKFKSGKEKSQLLLSLKSIPDKSLEYFRLYRNVKIYTAILEFIIPLYEQAKFEEQKEMPVLQVIDKAIPPEKKAYPPRILFSILITLSSVLLVFFILVFKELLKNSTNPKILELKKIIKK
ncbi:Wzz/FepE/Etk N-terminal domain-containing protein [Ignavibacterium sp.]|uniref:GumC family protein n=1 Tax=Ignavibacterium sp. TaxID=2651167 RepID=UPI0021FBBCA8|nr:Wzz/FepE/Etk N-terminal domain-containing protein [Ignavibacterium sp.]BDQ04190.1 MAG: hypothetical protein KatS3mg037_2765 [Ignavibacterium sp.]